MKSLQEHLLETIVLEKYTPEEQEELASSVIAYFTQRFKDALDNMQSIANNKYFYSIHAYVQQGSRWDWDYVDLPNNSKSKAFKLAQEYVEFVYNQLVNATTKDVKADVLNKDGTKKWASFDLFTPRFSKTLNKKYEEIAEELKGLWGDVENQLAAGDVALKDTHSNSRDKGNDRVIPFMHYVSEYVGSRNHMINKDVTIGSGYLSCGMEFSIEKHYPLFMIEHHPEPQNMVQGELPQGLKDAFGTEIAVGDLVLWKEMAGYSVAHVKGAAGKYVVLDKFVNKDYMRAMPASLVVLKSQGQPIDFEQFIVSK